MNQLHNDMFFTGFMSGLVLTLVCLFAVAYVINKLKICRLCGEKLVDKK
jgi:sorbitol-specific phosphotransferase system component IIC